jgi:hypothetical protein
MANLPEMVSGQRPGLRHLDQAEEGTTRQLKAWFFAAASFWSKWGAIHGFAWTEEELSSGNGLACASPEALALAA